jgi:hypothetical protein
VMSAEHQDQKLIFDPVVFDPAVVVQPITETQWLDAIEGHGGDSEVTEMRVYKTGTFHVSLGDLLLTPGDPANDLENACDDLRVERDVSSLTPPYVCPPPVDS